MLERLGFPFQRSLKHTSWSDVRERLLQCHIVIKSSSVDWGTSPAAMPESSAREPRLMTTEDCF